MTWINEYFGTQFSDGTQLALLFAILIVALLLVFWMFRKVFGGPGTRHSRSRQPRLSVTDVTAVDDKRRLVLVRRDNVEHLILIGGPSDIVVEQNIFRVAPVAVPSPASHTTQSVTPAAAVPSQPAASQVPAPTPKPVKSELDNSAMFPVSPAPTVSLGKLSSPTVASVGGAALAGAGALAISAKETAAQTADTVSQSAEQAVLAGSKASTTAVDRLSQISAVESEPAAEEYSAPATGNLDPTLSDDLHAALGLDDTVQSVSVPEVNVNQVSLNQEPKSAGSPTDDEMQRLLKELAAGN